MSLKLGWVSELYTNWQKDRVSILAAALSYYAVFSILPILLICISVAGAVFGENAARGQVLEQIDGLLGAQVALQIQELIKNAHHPGNALNAQIFSIFILFFSASGVFSAIQDGLNTIWGVKNNPDKKWFALLKSRLLSFAMVLIAAFLLLVSLVLSALLTLLSSHITYFMGANIFLELTTFLIVTLLFAMMFKYLPEVNLRWSNIWVGAVITSFLFSFGKILIGYYLNQIHIASVFGAASFLIILLIWVYYSTQIFFIGAEITKIYSLKRDEHFLHP
jgi:membrane protein